MMHVKEQITNNKEQRFRERIFSVIPLSIQIVVIGLLLFWKFQLGLVRYVDIDEYAHLHWAYNFFSGAAPYRDFFYFFPPGFLLFLSPLFLLFGKTAEVFLAARVVSFFVLVLLSVALFLLVASIRNKHTALLTIILFLFLPLPADKMLEVRPDTLALTFTVLGLLMVSHRRFFLSGLFSGFALAVVPKVLLFTLLIVGMLGIGFWHGIYRRKHVASYVFGLLIPLCAVCLFFLWSGDPHRAIYLTTTFAVESTQVLGKKFYIAPLQFFLPNDTYYGEGGVGAVLITTWIVYAGSVLWSLLQGAHVLRKPVTHTHLVEMVLLLGFVASLFSFFFLIPLKHTQYLIPLAPLVALFFADGIILLGKRLMYRRFPLALVLFALSFLLLGMRVFSIKKNWLHTKTFAWFATIAKTIPKDATVFDLYGASLFYKDAYYVCCIPYGQYTEAFAFPLPSMPDAFTRTNTQYVLAYESERLDVLPKDQKEYILSNFVPIEQYPLILRRRDMELPQK